MDSPTSMGRQVLLWLLGFSLGCVVSDHCAAAGLVSIVDGKARLLRGTSVYAVREGVAIEHADIVETEERTHVQVEFPDGSALGIGPRSSVYLASADFANVVLGTGWLKLSGSAPSGRMRCTTSGLVLQLKSGAFVARRQDPLLEVFAETGQVTASHVKSGARLALLKAGDFAETRPDRSLNIIARPNAEFLAALPRSFVDTLPLRAAKFSGRALDPTLDREAGFDDVDRWLNVYPTERKALLARFSSRLKDKAFRQKAEDNLLRYPEWDRILHPEKYLRKDSATRDSASKGPAPGEIP